MRPSEYKIVTTTTSATFSCTIVSSELGTKAVTGSKRVQPEYRRAHRTRAATNYEESGSRRLVHIPRPLRSGQDFEATVEGTPTSIHLGSHVRGG